MQEWDSVIFKEEFVELENAWDVEFTDGIERTYGKKELWQDIVENINSGINLVVWISISWQGVHS